MLMVFWLAAPALMRRNLPELPASIGRLTRNLGAIDGYPYASAQWKKFPSFRDL